MIKIKDTQSKITAPTRTITVSNISIKKGHFVDEEGSIVEKVVSNLPEGVSEFDIKIKIELPEE